MNHVSYMFGGRIIIRLNGRRLSNLCTWESIVVSRTSKKDQSCNYPGTSLFIFTSTLTLDPMQPTPWPATPTSMCFCKLFAIILSLFLNFEKCCSSVPPLSLYNVVHHVLLQNNSRLPREFTTRSALHLSKAWPFLSYHAHFVAQASLLQVKLSCLLDRPLELGFGAAIASQSTRHTFSLNRMLNSGYTNEKMYSEISVGIWSCFSSNSNLSAMICLRLNQLHCRKFCLFVLECPHMANLYSCFQNDSSLCRK